MGKEGGSNVRKIEIQLRNAETKLTATNNYYYSVLLRRATIPTRLSSGGLFTAIQKACYYRFQPTI
jgi:hypothetical protein